MNNCIQGFMGWLKFVEIDYKASSEPRHKVTNSFKPKESLLLNLISPLQKFVLWSTPT